MHSYVGSFGVTLAKYGASRVTCVDVSGEALELGRHAAALNAVEDRLEFIQADAFVFLEDAENQSELYDVIIMDPPEQGGGRSKAPGTLKLYERAVYSAAKRCATPGLLLVSCCVGYCCICIEAMSTATFLSEDPLANIFALITWGVKPRELTTTESRMKGGLLHLH